MFPPDFGRIFVKTRPVSWFRSSQYPDIALNANFETKTTLGINGLPVAFDYEIRSAPDIDTGRIS